MSELSSAIKHICDEKGLEVDAVISTIEYALAAAYRKDFGEKNQNIVVEFNVEKGNSKVYDVKTVVEDMPEEEEKEEVRSEKLEEEGENEEVRSKKSEEGGDEKVKSKKSERNEKSKDKEKKEAVEEEKEEEEEEKRKFNPKTEIQLSDAKLIKKGTKVGDVIKTKLEIPEAYGRMAAQTAKQVIIQRLREAEREMIFNEFKDKQNEVVSGVVQRQEGRVILIDLGKSVGVLPPDEQIPGEKYLPGSRIKVYVKEVGLKPKGPEIILSRTSDEILKKIFYLEIPEIANGLIELKAVAREAGSRAKVAVWTDSENVDPIGSCVGQRGSRIQTIINELGGEKVDIIEWNEDVVKFISNSLSPAKINRIKADEKEKKATVFVANDQLSLAIGKHGQNARLAAKLSGWKIDITEDLGEEAATDKSKEDEKIKKGEVMEEQVKKENEKKESKEKKNAKTEAKAEKEK